MKLHQSVLAKLIDLPTVDAQELRLLLDDLGLEVKKAEILNGKGVYTIETLANRGDHTYALGVARELSARLLTQLKHPSLVNELGDRKASVQVRNLTEKCLAYALLDLVLPKHISLPNEFREVLDLPADDDKHPIVHILNYVLAELGQPMHAFDYEKIEGEISVELSSAAETVEALDGKTYKVPPQSILIRDRKKTVAVAGVIGLKNSMVTRETRRVLIESALFDPVTVRLTARAMGLSTDASYLFERGGDRDSVVTGLKRAVYLISGGNAVASGEAGSVVGVTSIISSVAENRRVTIQLADFRRELNLQRLEDVEVTSRLKNLGYGIEVKAGSKPHEREFSVGVPTWRMWDVFNQQDLIEDFARSKGLSSVKAELPPLDYEIPEFEPIEQLAELVEVPLLGAGFKEVITKGFYSADDAALVERFLPESHARHVTIKNSLEGAYSHMKHSNVLHFARLCEANHRQGVSSCKIFELGRIFSLERADGSIYEYERDVLSLGLSGRFAASEYKRAESQEDLIFHFKGVIESIFASLCVSPEYRASKLGIYHPGIQVEVRVGRARVGSFGLIHPELKACLDIRSDLIYAELDVDQLIKIRKNKALAEPIDLPAIKRDITLKLPKRSLAGNVLRFIDEGREPNLEQVCILDDFHKADEDFRRTTFRLVFRDAKRTLEHSEVDAAMQRILELLKTKEGLELAG